MAALRRRLPSHAPRWHRCCTIWIINFDELGVCTPHPFYNRIESKGVAYTPAAEKKGEHDEEVLDDIEFGTVGIGARRGVSTVV